MTSVLLERDKTRYTLTCRDHADSAEVCAAISALCFTLAGYTHNIQCVRTDEKLEPGDVHLCFLSDEPAAKNAFDMICVGFLQLAKSYGDQISVDLHEIF